MDSKFSRRDILTKAAVFGAGAAIGGLGGFGTGNAFAQESASSQASDCPVQYGPGGEDGEQMSSSLEWAHGEANKFPWPYTKLDPEVIAEAAYEGWWELGCGGTVIASIVGALAEKIGEPYKSFPAESFVIFEGGVAGWGTLCGSLNGAAVAVSLIVGPPTIDETTVLITTNLMDWYCHSTMPIYIPKNPRANKKSIVHTVSESPLCHVSVGKWVKAANFPSSSTERKDRCARLSATVAYKTVEILNEWVDGNYHEGVAWFAPQQVFMPSQQNCAKCHGEKVPRPPLPEGKEWPKGF